MAISENALSKEAKRLFRLPFAPNDPEERAALLREFMRILRDRITSEEHLKAVVNWLIDHAGRCPPPAEVLTAAENVKAQDKRKAPRGCDLCEFTGYVHFTKLVHPKGVEPYEADFSEECECELGQFKRNGYKESLEDRARMG